MRFVPAVLVLLVLGLGLAFPCEAATDSSRDMERLERLRESVDVQADRIDYAEGERKIVASGKVRVTVGTRQLFADEVSVDLDDQVLVATGNALLTEGLDRLEGDRIEYNYRTNLGVVTNGRGTMQPGVSFSGVEIRREGENQYALREARFTACRACQPEPITPDWEFRASQTTIYQDEWITARNASLWIKGIPSLYTPAIALPLGPRRTGFLIPRFGYGDRDGFTVKQPFFWAISRSQDVTLTAIYRTNRGPEVEGEYRYVLDELSRGTLYGRYLHDLESGEESASRGEVKWLHNQIFSPTWRFQADVKYQSDRNLSRDFVDSSVADRTQRILESNAFVTQTTPQYMLLGLVGVAKNLALVGEKEISRLPEVRFQWLPAPLFHFPLVGEGVTSAVYFERGDADDAGRFDLHPILHLPLTLLPWLTSTTSTGLRETAYTVAATPEGDTNRFLMDFRQRLGSTFLRRFENPGFGFTRLTHIVDSSLLYEYVPWVDQQSLLQFDAVDFVSPQNRLTYRLVNRLMGRTQTAGGQVRTYEVANLTIAQSLNLQPKTREFSDPYLESLTPERVDQAVRDVQPLPNGFSRATERRLSNLVFQGLYRPVPALAGYATVAVNTERIGVEGVNSGIEVRLWDGVSLEAGQTYVRDRQVDGIVSRLLWKVTQNLSFDVLTRYDIRLSTLLENNLTVRVGTCCWELGLRYIYRSEVPGRPEENSLQVLFDLKLPTPTAGQ